LLPLVAGVALAGTLQIHLSSEVRLKWPNDLYVGNAKLGGILVEGMSRGESAAAVVGFGVNHGPHPPRLEAHPTTSVQLQPGSQPQLADLAVHLATAVHTAIDRPLPRGRLMERIRQLSFHQNGDSVEVSTAGGSISGLFRGVDEQGLLVLETDGGVERVGAGEIVHS
jgi:BirA family biotin operon repressor/biotin-[acetyl-CoA-carboxylase] ligase